jgi:Neuraminidase (sialidase)
MPNIEVDHSNGPNRGNIYVNWSDQKNGENDTDIWLISSKNNGQTWSKPIRVNNDRTKTHQFLSWMDVDPSTGYIYIVFYDRRHSKDDQTDVYLAISKNGGLSFSNHRINKETFTPKTNVFFGDYNDISAINGVVRPIWTQQIDDELSIHTAIIKIND